MQEDCFTKELLIAKTNLKSKILEFAIGEGFTHNKIACISIISLELQRLLENKGKNSQLFYLKLVVVCCKEENHKTRE